MPMQAARPSIIVRQHPKLRDHWPPEPGGAFPRNQGFRSPEGGADILEQVLYYAPVGRAKADVALSTKYEGQCFTRDILLDDAEFASRLASWLRGQLGRSIREIGEMTMEGI
jgi:hypothetical protein